LGFARERLSREVFARLQAAVADFEDDPSALTSRIGGWLSKGLLGLVSLGLWALGMPIIPFFVYYLLLDMSNLRRIIEEHIPERYRGAGRRLLDEVGDVAPGYVRGRFLMALIMAAIFFLAPAPATPDGETTVAQRTVAATVSTAQAEADAQRVVAPRESPPKEP
jgi:predicted PurR-regulated permease PerM